MKIVLNKCFGGFGLSPAALKRWAELHGRQCYFFKEDWKAKTYTPISLEEASKSRIFTSAYDINNPQDLTMQERNVHGIWDHSIDRTDPFLIQVVEEMGSGHRTGASGLYADLRIVEIPDDVSWEIDEYDGVESIHERHRSWG